MSTLTKLDWKWLGAVGSGEAEAAPKRHQDKLLALSLVIARHRPGTIAITGLGRDALLRKKYGLDIPQAEAAEPPQTEAVDSAADPLEADAAA